MFIWMCLWWQRKREITSTSAVMVAVRAYFMRHRIQPILLYSTYPMHENQFCSDKSIKYCSITDWICTRSHSPQGLFTDYLRFLNPYGAYKLIRHALKLYGPRTGRKNRTAAIDKSYVLINALWRDILFTANSLTIVHICCNIDKIQFWKRSHEKRDHKLGKIVAFVIKRVGGVTLLPMMRS